MLEPMMKQAQDSLKQSTNNLFNTNTGMPAPGGAPAAGIPGMASTGHPSGGNIPMATEIIFD